MDHHFLPAKLSVTLISHIKTFPEGSYCTSGAYFIQISMRCRTELLFKCKYLFGE